MSVLLFSLSLSLMPPSIVADMGFVTLDWVSPLGQWDTCYSTVLVVFTGCSPLVVYTVPLAPHRDVKTHRHAVYVVSLLLRPRTMGAGDRLFDSRFAFLLRALPP